MKKFSWKRIIVIILLALAVFGATRVFSWMQGTMGPSEEALAALRSDNTVSVVEQGRLITFEKPGSTSTTGFILYPGAGVDFRSYAPVLRQIAQEGYSAFLPSMPLNIAFLNANAAKKIIAEHPEIENWVIAGHSLGGVVAADYAVNYDSIDGMVFWASYPADDALKTSIVQVLSISASLDGLSTPDKIEASRQNLPANAQFKVIEGGNHAQFGSYGPQPGDNPAIISSEEQNQSVAMITKDFLGSISEPVQ